MGFQHKFLNIVKCISGSLLSLGIILFCLGLFVNHDSILAAIGVGTMMGAFLIFLCGVFFSASEEMVMIIHNRDQIAQTKKEERLCSDRRPLYMHRPTHNPRSCIVMFRRR